MAACPFSAYSYVEAFADIRLAAWIDAHPHAFEHSGGTGQLLVPDNLRIGCRTAARYEPVLNPAWARLAERYGTAVVPARVVPDMAGHPVRAVGRHGRLPHRRRGPGDPGLPQDRGAVLPVLLGVVSLAKEPGVPHRPRPTR